MRIRLSVFVLLQCATLVVWADGLNPNTAELEFFEKRVRPLLAQRCYSCHSQNAKTVHGGLKLDTAVDLFRGGDSGPVVVRGKPDESLLIDAIRGKRVTPLSLLFRFPRTSLIIRKRHPLEFGSRPNCWACYPICTYVVSRSVTWRSFLVTTNGQPC